MRRRLRVSREAARDMLWEDRDAVAIALLCHDCRLREEALELLEAVGWSEMGFCLAYAVGRKPRW